MAGASSSEGLTGAGGAASKSLMSSPTGLPTGCTSILTMWRPAAPERGSQGGPGPFSASHSPWEGPAQKHQRQAAGGPPGRLGGWLPPCLLHQGLCLWLQETSGLGWARPGAPPLPASPDSLWLLGLESRMFLWAGGSALHFRLSVSPGGVQGSRGPCRLQPGGRRYLPKPHPSDFQYPLLPPMWRGCTAGCNLPPVNTSLSSQGSSGSGKGGE